ncbi:MAG: RDD family protein [Reichenbachiella sp.]
MDYIVTYIVAFIVLTLLIIFPKKNWVGGESLWPTLEVIHYFVYFFYYLLFEMNCRQTLGKVVTRTKVVGEDNSNATPSQIFKRTLFRMFWINLLSGIWSKRILHDSLSETKVVYLNK